MEQTNALHRDFDPENPNPRSSRSKKWGLIMKPIWQDIVEGQDNDSNEEEEEEEEEEEGGGGLIMKKVVKYPFRDGKINCEKMVVVIV